jgi:hypothetical protein
MGKKVVRYIKNILEGKKKFYLGYSKFLTLVLAVGLIIGIAVLIFVYLLPSRVKKEEKVVEKPTGKAQITPPYYQVATGSTKEKIIAKTPVETPEFLIFYFPKNDTFDVSIQKTPIKENVNEALAWFNEQGIGDICQLNINWITPKKLWEVAQPTDFPICKK